MTQDSVSRIICLCYIVTDNTYQPFPWLVLLPEPIDTMLLLSGRLVNKHERVLLKG